MTGRAVPFLAELERVARARPRAVAIEADVRITYAELIDRVAALAARLRRSGIGRESLVGLCLGPVPEHLVALLAVWRAGAAWLPLDPEWPAGRLRALVRDAAACSVIAAGAAARVFAHGPVKVLDPAGSCAAAGGATGPSRRAAAAGAGDLAYVIYTSGSSGRPKGVEITHRGLVPLLRAQIRAFRLGRSSRCLLYLSTVFDASISDIGTCLLTGATLCLEPGLELLAPADILARLAERRITHVDLPPSLLARLDPAARPASLETVVIGGEACAVDAVRAWAPRVRLVNVYGPTEATICTSLGVCTARWSRPLLGRPVAGMRYVVVDDALAPVAPGTPGELLIEGAGLARGYRGDPALTNARFVQAGGRRHYRTGDRVVRHADGEIEFLGRLDRQLKLRGYRIEPEEIEFCLARHPAVVRVAVIARRVGPADALVAFVVMRSAARVTSPARLRHELMRHAAAELPRWMVPRRVELVDELPALASGKVDAGALARRPLAPAGSPRGSALRDGPVTRLRAIWEQVLGSGAFTADDDFFEVGGDSLGALEVVARARAAGLDLAPSWLESPVTLRRLATRLRRLARERRVAHPEAAVAGALRRGVAFSARWSGVLDRAAERRADPGAPIERVLVTGGTGFLGSRVVRELLARTRARVVCLVRGAGEADAGERLERALAAHGPGPLAIERLEVVRGDVSRARLGLSPSLYARLAREIDTIVHCAAAVHASRPYRALKAVNVDGAREVLALMARGRPKRLHHASTLSVFVATDHTGPMREDDHLDRTGLVWGGYAQTKWAAEVMLRAAAGRAGPVVHYRFGLLTGDTVAGRMPARDLFALLVRAVASAGCVPAPAPAGLALDVTPVDYAAAAMVHLIASAPANDGATYHLANSRRLKLPGLLSAIRAAGVPIARVPRAEWERLVERLPERAAGSWLPLVRALGTATDLDRLRGLDLFCATGARFDTARTRAGLAGSGLACPPPDPELIERYVRAVLGVGAR